MKTLMKTQTKTFARNALLAFALLLGTRAEAEQVLHLGAYDVHYVVLGTTFLNPDVAKQYGIERGKDLAFVNISVLRNGQPIAAQIQGRARDLLDRRVDLRFREIKERTSVYYIAVLHFSDQEHWHFELKVTPVGMTTPLDVKFAQRLYAE